MKASAKINLFYQVSNIKTSSINSWFCEVERQLNNVRQYENVVGKECPDRVTVEFCLAVLLAGVGSLRSILIWKFTQLDLSTISHTRPNDYTSSSIRAHWLVQCQEERRSSIILSGAFVVHRSSSSREALIEIVQLHIDLALWQMPWRLFALTSTRKRHKSIIVQLISRGDILTILTQTHPSTCHLAFLNSFRFPMSPSHISTLTLLQYLMFALFSILAWLTGTNAHLAAFMHGMFCENVGYLPLPIWYAIIN